MPPSAQTSSTPSPSAPASAPASAPGAFPGQHSVLQVNGYAAVHDALGAALLSLGFAPGQAQGVLHRDGCFLQLLHDGVQGVTVRLGTGANNAGLTGTPRYYDTTYHMGGRIGPLHKYHAQSEHGAVAWPATCHLFVFDQPLEVYLLLQYNGSQFYWLCLGRSAIPLPGTGLWVAGNAALGFDDIYTSGSWTPTYSGELDATHDNPGIHASLGPWWHGGVGSMGYYSSMGNISHAIHTGLDAQPWAGNVSTGTQAQYVPGIRAGIGGFSRAGMPRRVNEWNGQALMLPITVHQERDEQFYSPVLQCQHACWMRIDGHEPLDVFTIGHEHWQVFPFHQKNTAHPDGSTSGAPASARLHSGTFGWCIRHPGVQGA